MAEYILAELKAQWDEGVGRMLLGDNTGRGAAIPVQGALYFVLKLE
jgi:hypothetical protein